MGKIAITLLSLAIFALLPDLVQAQSFKASGFRGSSALRSGSFNRGGTVPAFRGVFGKRGSMSKGNSGFSNATNTNFSNNFNTTPSTFNKPFSAQSQGLINTRGNRVKSVHIPMGKFTTRSFNTSKGLPSSYLKGERMTKVRHNVAFTPLRNKSGLSLPESESNSEPTSDLKTGSLSRRVNLRGLGAVQIINNRPGAQTNIEDAELNNSSYTLSNNPVRTTEISHWVDNKTGVQHFSNNVTSFRRGKETIVFVNGKKLDSKSATTNSNKTITTGSRDSKNGLSGLNVDTVESRVTRDRISRKATALHHGREHKQFHHHSHHHHFFVSPFFTLPQSAFFFAFNPFVFRALVLSPFFTFSTLPNFFFVTSPFVPLIPSPLFDPFVFRPVFFPSFSNPFSFGSVFFFANPILSNPAFVFAGQSFIH